MSIVIQENLKIVKIRFLVPKIFQVPNFEATHQLSEILLSHPIIQDGGYVGKVYDDKLLKKSINVHCDVCFLFQELLRMHEVVELKKKPD